MSQQRIEPYEQVLHTGCLSLLFIYIYIFGVPDKVAFLDEFNDILLLKSMDINCHLEAEYRHHVDIVAIKHIFGYAIRYGSNQPAQRQTWNYACILSSKWIKMCCSVVRMHRLACAFVGRMQQSQVQCTCSKGQKQSSHWTWPYMYMATPIKAVLK